MRVEDPEVFEATHRLILDLLRRGLVQGLRVDHVDGLADPAAYLERLAARAADAAGHRVPIWVEKILVGDEKLPADWPVAGTTGYEFAALATRILLAADGLPTLERLRARRDPGAGDFAAVEAAAKRQVLEQLFPGELGSLVQELAGLLGRPQVAVREAALALIVAFPVYRTYLRAGREPCDADRRVLARATSIAAPTLGEPAAKVLDELSAMLAGPLEPEVAHLAARLQQLTGPAMAKSVEDTAFYRFPRLLALNEVGNSPAAEGIADDEAHRLLAERGEAWPMALAGHVDARHQARGGRQGAAAGAGRAAGLLGRMRSSAGAGAMPGCGPRALHPIDEASLYQAMVGVWPPALAPGDAHGLAQLRERLAGWQRRACERPSCAAAGSSRTKPTRRRRMRSSRAVLDPERSAGLSRRCGEVVGRLAPAGVANSLAQTLIKLTAPGVPDVYQGGELWDLSLVDPDNRRPIDWAARERQLGSEARLDELLADWRNGA